MDDQTKHEIWVTTMTTLAAVPPVAVLGFFVVTGLLAI